MKKFKRKSEAHFQINPDLTQGKEINVFATEKIIDDLSDKAIQQAINTAHTTGVEQINLNADAHEGYGCPIGSVVATKDTIMLGPVGYDISCSVSYLQTDLDIAYLQDKKEKRKLINKICEYIPYGAGKTRAKKQVKVSTDLYHRILNKGASENSILKELDIPESWSNRLERTSLPADSEILTLEVIKRGEGQLGSLGGGNHFLELQNAKITEESLAKAWGVSEGAGFLTHCGSRGLGHQIATEYFRTLWKHFDKHNLPLADKELVFAEIDSGIGQNYLKSMGCAANFAIINHMILNNAIKQALEELFTDVQCNFVYLISHNLAQKEQIDDQEYYIHRKGATRAFPAGHPALLETPFAETGHPVIIPGSSLSGSSIMVGLDSAKKNMYTVPHGAGRAMGRREARRNLTQEYVNKRMEEANILFNSRNYPIDEFGEAYKNYDEVVKSVIKAGLAKEVARLKPEFVIKGD